LNSPDAAPQTPTAMADEHKTLRARIEASLQRQGMMQHLGVRLVAV
jgi:hypothetical protein